MGRRCCCKGGNCLIFEDLFNRPNSTSLGSKWTEDAGDSEIFNGTLRMPPESRVLCTVPHPQWDATCYARVELPEITVGDRFRLIVDYDEDWGDYLFGEYEAEADGAGLLKVGSAFGGIANYLHVLPGGHQESDNYLIVCRSPGAIYAQTPHSSIAWACVGRAGEGKYVEKPYQAGLENPGANNTIRFDNFQFQQHDHTLKGCPQCECDCEGYCVGKTILLTYVATGFCDCWGGQQISLEWDRLLLPEFVWEGSKTLKDPYCTSPEEHRFRLYCDRDPAKWVLRNLTDTPSTCDDQGIWNQAAPGAYPSAHTCDPFSLTFGPFYCDASGPEGPIVCEYFLVATASP